MQPANPTVFAGDDLDLGKPPTSAPCRINPSGVPVFVWRLRQKATTDIRRQTRH